jgi:fermentation-respiration switch protein FrsA (DUF1100 family)
MSALGITLLALVVLLGAGILTLLGLAWYVADQMISRRKPDPLADPAELGLEYEPVVFPSRDGLHLGGWFVPAASPQRGTVIFCHGHNGSLDPDLKYVPAFRRHGFSVLQFDFRAHGRSEGSRVSMGTLERLDLLGAIDYLRARGIERVGVLGFSMGAAVAIYTAARCPAIAALASDGGFPSLQPTLAAGLRQRGIPAWLAQVLTPLAVRFAGWRLGSSLPDTDPIRWIADISPRPVFFVHAGRDAYVSLAEIEGLYAAAGDPKQLWIVPEAEHRRVDQARPDEYLTRLLDFFGQWLAEDDRPVPAP